MAGETRYVRISDGSHVAFNVTGQGPIDLLVCTEWTLNVDLMREHPALSRLTERLGSSARVICMNRRGTGASDPLPVEAMASVDDWVIDASAVLNAALAPRAAVMGIGHGGHVAMALAAREPERVSHLVLVNSYARALWADDHPTGFTEESLERYVDRLERSWGKRSGGATFDPDLWSEAGFPETLARLQRLTASPAQAAAIQRMTNQVDVRHLLPEIRVPTLVVFQQRSAPGREHAQHLAEHIGGAQYVELPGYHYFTTVKNNEAMADSIAEFLTGVAVVPVAARSVATVLFTDLVGSTETASRAGDEEWRRLLDLHDAAVRRQLARHRGREVHTTGDGFLALFSSPSEAIRCAFAIHDAVRGVGLSMRAGLHCAEVELRGDDVAGVAVHLAERISSQAGAGEVVVSRTVVDLVGGAPFAFTDLGEHPLKGITRPWQLFRVQP